MEERRSAIMECVIQYAKENKLDYNKESLVINSDVSFATFQVEGCMSCKHFAIFVKITDNPSHQKMFIDSFVKYGEYLVVDDTNILCVIRSGLMPIAANTEGALFN